MRKVFTLLLFTVLATIGVRAGTSTGTYSYPNMTINIDDDPALENLTFTSGAINWVNSNGSFIIKGTAINQTGVSKIAGELDSYITGISLNLTDASFDGEWTEISTKFSKVLLNADAELPPLSVLTANTNLTYVYSSVSSTGTDVRIYVKSGTTLSSITEITDDIISGWINSSVKIQLSGEGAESLKADLTAKGISEENIKIPVLFNGTLTAAGGSVSSAIDNYNEGKEESEKISADDVKYLEVTGTLTAEDYAYIKGSLTNLVGIKLPDTYAVFPSEFSELNIKFATSDNAGVWVKNTAEGGLSAAINAIPSDWISSAKKITVSGPIMQRI